MTLIKVPVPVKMQQSAYDPDRPISSLLKMQVEHLYEAEKRLPSRYQSDIYVNAIHTEGEAARYIRTVTEAIHAAHEDAKRVRSTPRRKKGLEIAAVADDRAERQRSKVMKRKRISKKRAHKS